MRLRISPGSALHIGVQGRFPEGTVVDVHSLTEAQQWIDQGWGTPAPDAPVYAVGKLPGETVAVFVVVTEPADELDVA